MAILKEFREFAVRGNAIDLAVGVVVGTAFAKIVEVLVKDVLVPAIGFLLGQPDWPRLLNVSLGSGPQQVTIKLGSLVAALGDFLLIALAAFIAIKLFNRARARLERDLEAADRLLEHAAARVRAPHSEMLLQEIGDAPAQPGRPAK